MTLVKVCGITSIGDAIACVESGADMLGFIFADSPRRVNAEVAGEIVRLVSGRVKTVGVFTEQSDQVIETVDRCRLDYAQLHGSQSEEFARRVGADRVIRVARVRDSDSVNKLADHPAAAFYLLDTYRPDRAGGTGQTFDWSLAVAAKSMGKHLILSGGLTPGNVAEAVMAVRPYAVDVSSGVESEPGKKDHQRVKEFISNVREADAAS